mgnify:FL=1
MVKMSFGEKCFKVFNVIFMILLSLAMLYPLMYVIFASLSDSNALRLYDGMLLHPIGFTTTAYTKVFQNPMIYKGFLNTIYVLFFGTLTNTILTVVTGYVLSRRDFSAAKYMNIFVIVTMYFSGGLIPTFLTVKALGLFNNRWVLIIPSALSTYNLIIMRAAFLSVPKSLEEAAFIDGANHMTVLFKILVPVVKATIAVIVLYSAVGHWNSWFNAMIYIQDANKFPLQLVLRSILIQNDTSKMTQAVGDTSRANISETIKYATIVVATIPILAIYPFLQKYFVKGTMLGAVKE